MRNKKQFFRLILMMLLVAGNLFSATKVLGQPNVRTANNRQSNQSESKNNKNTSSDSSATQNKPSPTQARSPNSRQEQSTEIDEPNSSQPESSGGKKQNGEVVEKSKNDAEVQASWFDFDFLFKWGLIALTSLLVLGGIVAGAYFLRRNKQRERGEIVANFSQLKKQQKAFGEEIKQLSEVSKNLSQQIALQKTEISGLKQLSRNPSYVSAPPSPPTISAYRQPAEVPQFPVSVDDYLAKVKNVAIPVKYERKEKMLVQDGENEGGLLVVRDDSAAGDLLYLVPSFGFFQTKSDYTSYFENYYACARPTGGSVWIRQPATVNRVNGGWQLAQQGELEVR
jgi:hypothetical protein